MPRRRRPPHERSAKALRLQHRGRPALRAMVRPPARPGQGGRPLLRPAHGHCPGRLVARADGRL
ncbi:hypothetical protein DK847_18990 [Aestuariivirga litoralis]|uniref:Uncharacterized protein n=1 Tax=Aestuariivirga litoralis TaxID=2650924 RepID=A0A2W2BGM2_9HYPH|nr:hypothetical protein DK847_18990 [Aestuariivirga litoralis]